MRAKRSNSKTAKELSIENEKLRNQVAELKLDLQKYKNVFDMSGDALSILSLDTGKFIECNDAAIKMHGVDNEKNFLNLTPDKLSPERQPCGGLSHELAMERIQKTFSEGPQVFEWVHKKIDGTTFPCLVSLSPIPIEGKNLILAIGRDITQLKELAQSNQRYKDISDSMQQMTKIGGWELDVQTMETFWTKGVYEIYGLPYGMSMNKIDGISFYSKKDQPRIEKYVMDCIEHGLPFDDEFELIRSNGEKAVVRAAGKPIYSAEGKITALRGSFKDISEQELDKRRLEEEIKKEKVILDATGIGTWDLNLIKNQLTWDDSMYYLYGIDRSSFTGDYEAWESTLHPDDIARATKELENAINGISPFDTTFRINHPKKGACFIRAKATVQRDESGTPVRIMGVNMDVTAEVNARHELETQRKMAAHASKLASIGELAAGVGHEINNPLAIANGNIARVKKELTKLGIQNNTINVALDKYKLASNRISTIVAGLRTFARSEDDHISKIDLVNAVQSTFSLVDEIFTKEGINLELSLPSKPVYVKGNEGRLQQVIMNLLSNARDATEGVLDRKISVKLTVSDELAIISVSDNGAGISPSIQDKIFENFFTTKEMNKGTGLGLAICDKIIQEHRGEISFRSQPGNGANFFIQIPLSMGKNSSQHHLQNGAFKNPKALIVDDEADIREILMDILVDLGCSVEEAPNGVIALEKMQSKKFDLLFTDLKMPKMDGFTLIQEIQKKDPDDRPKIFVITGGGSINFSKEDFDSLASFSSGLIFKPLDEQKVASLLALNNIHLSEKKAA